MSSQFQIAETTKDKKAAEGCEILTEKAPKDYLVNPREILIQVLHRPQEMIHPGIIDSSYTWVDQGCGFQRITDPFGGWVHISRNWQALQFLRRKEFKYLLILDADEQIPWWIPFHLAELDLPIVSGVVCGFTLQRGLFACVAVKGPDGRARFPSLKETKTIPLAGVQKVHNAGTGCIMIRRDVLEKMWLKYEKDNSYGQPFSIPEQEQNQAAVNGALPRGEDICFTDRARALGFDVHVDWACKVGHQKPFMLAWPEQAVSQLPPDKWARLAWPHVKEELATPQPPKPKKKRARKPRK
jgi:hypothetical protein